VIVFQRNIDCFNKTDFYYFAILSILLAFSTNFLYSGYDAGLYHLPHQLWLRTEPIVIGLANLHGRFGFGSLYEYISAPLWIGSNNLILLASLQISFLVFFVLFLIRQLQQSSGVYFVLLFAIVINLFLMGETFKARTYAYTDFSAGTTFAISFLYGYWLLFKKSSVLRNEWTVFVILLLASVLYKVSTVILILWLIFIMSYRVVKKLDMPREIIIGLIIPTVLLLIWLLKNIITTGCIFYPASFSCLDVSWSAKINAINDANWVAAWARDPTAGLIPLTNIDWFLGWWLIKYKSFLLTFFISGMLIYILSKWMIRRNSKNMNIKTSDIRLWGAVIFIVIALLFWFWKAPTPRFGIGVFMLFFPVLLLPLYKHSLAISFKTNKKLSRGLIVSLLFWSFAITLKSWEKLSINNMFSITQLNVPTIKTKVDSVYGVRPIKGYKCWLTPKCAPYDRSPLKKWNGYKMFPKKE
jgi:hypothetical protein